MYRALFALVVVGCGPAGPRTPADYGGVPTDTFPQFYGQVPRNIVMISMDTFRRDRLDRYGSEGVNPFLTAIAEAGGMMYMDDGIGMETIFGDGTFERGIDGRQDIGAAR